MRRSVPKPAPKPAAPRPAASATPRPRSFLVAGQAVPAGQIAPGLHVVATPIGNLGDITLRALQVLAAADVVLAEDTRTSRVLLGHYGISTPLEPYHEHNAAEMRPRVLARLAADARVALISDAGTPMVSDPGYKLALAAIQAGHPVTGAPGASAVLAALVLSGLPTDRFFFEGFLPPKSAARRARLKELAGVPGTLVLFESPRRLAETLADAAAVLGPRPAAVARELTKLHETVRRGRLDELAAAYAAEPVPRGEIVLLIGQGDGAQAPAADDLDARLAAALAASSLKQAVARLAAETGRPRREIYARALELTRRERGE